MVAEPSRRPVLWADGTDSYGWISIAFHWLSGAVILALLFIGSSIGFGEPGRMLHLHMSLALSAYPLLLARIAWRWAVGHPSRLPRQRRASYAVGRWFHIGLMVALAVMLVSGPVTAWSAGLPIDLWRWQVGAPFGPQAEVLPIARQAHAIAASCLGWGALVHVIAVAKHVAIDRDGALERMIVPTAGSAERAPIESEPPDA